MHSGTVWAAVQLFGRHATWQEQGLYHVGGRHTTWQEQDLAHGGGRHCHLAGTGLGSCWWQAHYLARTGAWFMLVAATTTWQLLGSCWWQAQYSVGERLHCWVQVRSLFFQKRFQLHFAVLKYTVFQNKSIISFVPVSLNSIRRTSFKAQSVKITAQSTCQSQSTIQETESENKILYRSVRITPKTQFTPFIFRNGLDRRK